MNQENPDRPDQQNSQPLLLPDAPSSTKKRGFKRLWLWILAFLLAALFLRAVWEKMAASREAARVSRESADPLVHVIHPEVRSAEKELVLPGNVQAFADTPIYARTSGYLKRWLVDIGARVSGGQLLAEIETPELDQQLNQALGVLQQARADMNLALITTKRWQKMLARDTVSRQEADEKQGSFEAQRANLIAAQANVARLQQLKAFERVYAPFDGVITVRNIDIGDLITANDTTQKEMFRIVNDHRLRVYINVPENCASCVKIDQPVKVVLASSPGVVAHGTVVNTASAIDPQSRTLLTEVRVDNSKQAFLSGGYATVYFDLKLAKPPLTLPVNTFIFRPEGTFVGVVGADGRASLHKVEIGKDFCTYLEVTAGISATDRIILNPSDSLQQGEPIRVENEKNGKNGKK